MTITRAFKRLVCLGLVGLMLFAQLAIAAYACPALATTTAPSPAVAESTVQAMHSDGMTGMSVGTSGERMPDCDQMAGQLDEAAPNLCAEHCRYGRQSDQVHAPAVPTLVLITLYVVTPTLPERLLPTGAGAAPSADALAAAFPPHAILHCCLRT